MLHHLPSPSMPARRCECGNRGRRKEKQRLDIDIIIIGSINNNYSSSRMDRRKKNDGLADGAGLDVGIWFNFKLIFPQQAPLAMPRA